MSRRTRWVAVAAGITLAVGFTIPAATAAPLDPAPNAAPKTDDLRSPLADKQRALRSAALNKVVAGKATAVGDNKVVKVAKGQYVELARQGEDSIWTVLGEFGTQVNPAYGGTPGPVHNQIPQPDRTVDNTTIWSPDFTRAYYEHMLFSETPGDISMRNFYLEQSSNRYTVNGHV